MAAPDEDPHPLAAWFGLPSLWALAFPVPAVVVTILSSSFLWGLVTILLTVAFVLAVRALRGDQRAG